LQHVQVGVHVDHLLLKNEEFNNLVMHYTTPHDVRVPAQSPFHKQLTEKRKDGRLCHLLLAKKRVSL
jgi:hypothetical protein